jgi:hypothetical protein
MVRQYDIVSNPNPPRNARRRRPRAVGAWLVGGAFSLTVALAFVPTTEGWGVTVAVILVLVGGGLQFGGAFMFDKAGRADPTLVRAAVGRLILLTAQAKRARLRAEAAFDSESGPRLKASVGQLSVELSFLEEGASASAQEWALFHPDAIDVLASEDQSSEGDST